MKSNQHRRARHDELRGFNSRQHSWVILEKLGLTNDLIVDAARKQDQPLANQIRAVRSTAMDHPPFHRFEGVVYNPNVTVDPPAQ